MTSVPTLMKEIPQCVLEASMHGAYYGLSEKTNDPPVKKRAAWKVQMAFTLSSRSSSEGGVNQ